jgi:hypothetical protein
MRLASAAASALAAASAFASRAALAARGDPRFHELMRKIGFTKAHGAADALAGKRG